MSDKPFGILEQLNFNSLAKNRAEWINNHFGSVVGDKFDEKDYIEHIQKETIKYTQQFVKKQLYLNLKCIAKMEKTCPACDNIFDGYDHTGCFDGTDAPPKRIESGCKTCGSELFHIHNLTQNQSNSSSQTHAKPTVAEPPAKKQKK